MQRDGVARQNRDERGRVRAGKAIQNVQQLTVLADGFALVFDFNLRAG